LRGSSSVAAATLADVSGRAAADPALARVGMVDALLADAVRGLGAPTVLDCGGGSGRYAVRLAADGATVTVVDVSIDALATLRLRAAEAGVATRVVAVQGDVDALGEAIGEAVFDLVLAHGILEVVESLPRSFAAIAAAVRPGGLLSVLVSNPVAAVLARALAGDLSGAERELALLDGGQPGPEAVHRLCAEAGLVVEQVHGIGVFRDLVPGAALDSPGARDALARVEEACAQRRPFAEIAGRVHLLARRPAS
jgi:S-adenosylmethionine-dependent methyltransferase